MMAVVPQTESSIQAGVESNPELVGIRWVSALERPCSGFYDTAIHQVDRLRERLARRKWRGVYRDWYFGPLYTWMRTLKASLREFDPDIVMLEHTRHAATLDFVRRICPRALRVVDSHNVESQLLRQVLPSSLSAARKQKILVRLEGDERELNRRCDILFSCSLADEERYRAIGVSRPRMKVIPNGVDTTKIGFRSRERNAEEEPRILFSGTLCYEPNEEGIDWFGREVWPQLKRELPGVRWMIVGRAPSPPIRALAASDSQIELSADVPSLEPFLASADVGICPLFSGSGTRLKILEAFSSGLPMVSTSVGVEGIAAENSEHLMIADSPVDFLGAIVSLIRDRELAKRLSLKSRRLAVERYDWAQIADDAASELMLAHRERMRGD